MQKDYLKISGIIEKRLSDFIGNKKAIIGISGGIDSTVVAYILARIIKKNNIIGITMPYDEQNTKDAEIVMNNLGITCHKINIATMVDSLLLKCSDSVTASESDLFNQKLVDGNVRARVRMSILYSFAGAFDGYVIGTGNKTEITLGYFTKYGDGGVDIEPIGDLYKTEVLEFAKFLGVPSRLIERVPSAELWEGQTDEGEIGMTYKEMDEIIENFSDVSKIYLNDYGDKGRKIYNRIFSSQHKRVMPPTILLGDKS